MRFTWYIIFVWWEFPNSTISPAFFEGAVAPADCGTIAQPGWRGSSGQNRPWLWAVDGNLNRRNCRRIPLLYHYKDPKKLYESIIRFNIGTVMRHFNDPCHPTRISISQGVLNTALLVSWHRKGWKSIFLGLFLKQSEADLGSLIPSTMLVVIANAHFFFGFLRADKFDIRDLI